MMQEMENQSSVEQESHSSMEQRLRLEQQAKQGANWFYWIAGLSVLNSVIGMIGGGISFVVGLGITQLVDGIALGVIEMAGSGSAPVVRGVAIVVNLVAAGAFVVFGCLAGKRYSWAFIVGMVLYGLDALLFIWVQDWFGFAFHVFAMWGLYTGIRALRSLRELEAAEETPTW